MSTEDMEKYRILESDKRYRAADRWLDNFSAASWSEVRTFIRSYVPPDKVKELLEMAREAEIARSPPIKVMGLEDRLSEELAWGRALRDNLSIVGSTIPPGDYETQTMPWSYIKEHVFLAPFKGDGGYLTITGKPRKGKTGCGCLYCQMWLTYNPGTEVLTNIPLQDSDKPPLGVRSVSAMSDLLRGIAAALADDRKWLWVLDEAGLVWLRAEAMTIRAPGFEGPARPNLRPPGRSPPGNDEIPVRRDRLLRGRYRHGQASPSPPRAGSQDPSGTDLGVPRGGWTPQGAASR